MRAPGRSPEEVARLYETDIEMAAYVDGQGECQGIAVSEHHASDDGFLPSPIVMASAIAAVTKRTPIAIAAALLPLYDPVRLAEEMIVLDHISRGRAIFTLGIGYRPDEYELHGVEYRRRGAIADEKLEILLQHLRAASSGDAAVRVTPAPFTAGGPMVTWGGTTLKAAQRAARFGLGFLSQSFDATLAPAYEQACKDAGTEPFFCYLPPADSPNSVFVHDDLEQGWSDVGSALLADAMPRSEEHTSELQSLMRISYTVFSLTKT